jgi:hypothetical protein
MENLVIRLLTLGALLATLGASASLARAQDTSTGRDTSDLLPPGFGSLRQDDIAIRVGLPSTQVRLIPLDEGVIRLLAPDSYRALHDLAEGRRAAVDQIAQRFGAQHPSLWYVSFYGIEPEARFDPQSVVLTSSGRDFRPLDVIPLSGSFGSHVVRQREVQSAIFVFEGGVNLSQPITATVETAMGTTWDENMLRLLDQARAQVRSRAGKTR